MSNQQKNIVLAIATLVAFFIAYQFAIKNTIKVRHTYKRLLKEEELLTNAESSIQYLQQQNRYLDTLLQTHNVSVYNSFQQTLLQKISSYTTENKLEITAFNEPHVFTANNTSQKTYQVAVKGNFIALLKLLHFVEQQKLGTIISVHFEKKKNYRRNQQYVIVQLFIQKIETM